MSRVQEHRFVDLATGPAGAGRVDRRRLLGWAGGVAAATAMAPSAFARNFGADAEAAQPIRYPDPDVVVLDKKRFKAKVGNAAIHRVHTGLLWAEGPAWNGAGRYLIFSDIPNNEILRFTEEDEHVARRFRSPSNNTNGNTFDREGRQISFRHLTRDVARYEYDGTTTVLAASFDGKGFNAPNDGAVHPDDGSIWFTDPGYGSLSTYEGKAADNGSPQPYRKEAVYRIDAQSGRIEQVADEPRKPNGLCFSRDYKKVYVCDTGMNVYPEAKSIVWQYDLDGTKLKNPRTFASMELDGRTGLGDGIRADTDGNLWVGAGWVGDGYDGVHVFAPNGDRIAQIRLPEICANVCFGGTKRNRLFMAASQSLYALYVETKGAHFC